MCHDTSVRSSRTGLFSIQSVLSQMASKINKQNSDSILQLVASGDSLSKACRNNSWSAWMSCRLGFLAAAIAAELDWYKPLAFPPPELNPAEWLPPEEPGLCGAILNGLVAGPTWSEDSCVLK